MNDKEYVAVKCQQALDVLRTNGWNQNSLVRNQTRWRGSPVCLMGAIKSVTAGVPWASNRDTIKVMLKVAERVPDGLLIDDWNDDPYTTFEDVESILEAIIEEHV